MGHDSWETFLRWAEFKFDKSEQTGPKSDRINVLTFNEVLFRAAWRPMKTIRASDIGTYLYCRRAWWDRLHGYESINQAELAAGSDLHHSHRRKVNSAGIYTALGLLLLLSALI